MREFLDSRRSRPWVAVLASALLSACASMPPEHPARENVPRQWFAARPHSGAPGQLHAWWTQFDDPLVPRLIAQAQSRNPSLAVATARVAQARAAARAAGATGRPTLDANLALARSHAELPPSPGTATTLGGSLDARWEIDLFGGSADTRRAASERAAAGEMQWHDARVSLAAEVASTYVALRACEAVLEVYTQDAASLDQTAALTRKKVDAGFDAPANGALSQASAADAANRVVGQRAECDVTLKALAALTVQPEDALRQALLSRRGVMPQPSIFDVGAIPTEVLSQRPDLIAAERELVAAAADVGAAEADRWPRLDLTGSIGRGAVRSGGTTLSGTSWSIGAGLLAPLFDAGRRKASAEGARARYDEARANWQVRALGAVREVEEALVRLDASTRREADARRAAQGYAEFFKASETQWRVGSGSLLDLEQARRSLLSANAALVQVQRERVSAWITLYKSVGGGWSPSEPPPR